MWLKLLAVIFLVFLSECTCSPLEDVDVSELKQISTFKKPNEFFQENLATYRLPNDSLPLKYKLKLTTDIDKGNFEFNGRVQIWINVTSETSLITLHYRQINVTSVILRTTSEAYVTACEFSTIESHEFLQVRLPSVQAVGDQFILDIRYIGNHRNDGGGFYRAYYDVDETRVWFATTQFEVTDARSALPCYDEPGIRAPISITIIHSSNYTAVANTRVISTQAFPPGYHTTIFEETPSMQTYLLAFLVSPYKYVSNDDSRVEQRIYAKPSSIENGEGDFAVGVVKLVLEKCEEHFGVEFPLPKMDHAAITQFNFGAMENMGLITYTETGLLYNPATLPANQLSRQMSITRLIAHEYVHQWFGNIVSPQWWSYTWLNEGFATLFQSYISSLLYPNLKYMNRFVTNELPRAFANDIGSSWSMNHYTEINDELWNKFGAIGYSKSGCVLRMFQETLTISTFAKGLKYYLLENYMRAATPQDLHRGLQKAYNEDFPEKPLDIDHLMGTWENAAGYPMVSIAINGNNFELKQRRYPTSNNEIYAIPLTFATKSNKNFDQKTPKAWLSTSSMIMPINDANFTADDWIILNLQQVGYYRVDYSTELWHALINQLKSDRLAIHELNRAVLQDEIYLAWTDMKRVKGNDVLEILRYLSTEDEPIAWSKAANSLNLLYNRLMGTDMFDFFLEFLQTISETHISRHGLEAIDYENADVTSLRSTARSWFCLGLAESCLSHEQTKFLNYYNSGVTSASINFCDAFRKDFDVNIHAALVNAVATNRSVANRNSYLQTLGCTSKEESIENFLATALDTANQLNANERRTIVVNTISRSFLAFEKTLKLVEENYSKLAELIPEDSMNTVMTNLVTFANTPASLAKINSLIDALRTANLITEAQKTSLTATISWNNQWHNENDEVIREYFDIEVTTLSASSITLSTFTIIFGILSYLFMKLL